jgi:hypothetical protein
MAGKLQFSLVAPEREVFSGLVDQVDAPGVEGDFGVLPDHAPFMTALREGVVTVFDNGVEARLHGARRLRRRHPRRPDHPGRTGDGSRNRGLMTP